MILYSQSESKTEVATSASKGSAVARPVFASPTAYKNNGDCLLGAVPILSRFASAIVVEVKGFIARSGRAFCLV